MDLRTFGGYRAAADAHRVAEQLLRFPRLSAGPLGKGVLGAGIGNSAEGTSFPLLLVDQSMSKPELVPFWDTDLPKILDEDLPDLSAPKDLLVFGLAEPQTNAARPGDPIECLGRTGTLGAVVTTRFGTPGILTAGHVAGPVGAPVTSGADPVGVVIFSENPSDAGVMTLSVDIAVVSVTDFKAEHDRTPPIVGSTSARPNEVVTVYGRNPVSTTVFALCEFISIAGGLDMNVWMTSQDASAPGDSGSPVLIAEPGVDEYAFVLGHVIGNSPGMATFVQDIECELAVSRTELRIA